MWRKRNRYWIKNLVAQSNKLQQMACNEMEQYFLTLILGILFLFLQTKNENRSKDTRTFTVECKPSN